MANMATHFFFIDIAWKDKKDLKRNLRKEPDD